VEWVIEACGKIALIFWRRRIPCFLANIKITRMIKEGTVPVLPCQPCASSDGDVLPARQLSHFWELISLRGAKALLSVQIFIEHFSRASLFCFFTVRIKLPWLSHSSVRRYVAMPRINIAPENISNAIRSIPMTSSPCPLRIIPLSASTP